MLKSMCVCVCVCVRARARVRVCVCVDVPTNAVDGRFKVCYKLPDLQR